MPNKLLSLQALRGIAALSVVMFHFRFYLSNATTGMQIPDKLFGWGGWV